MKLLDCSRALSLALALLCILSIGLSLASCSRDSRFTAILTVNEQEAVARLARDRWTDVLDVRRSSGSQLIARTRQGNETIDYLITFDDQQVPSFQRQPVVTFGSQGSAP